MRDPDRIDVVLAAVREAWVDQPDARLTQLLVNALAYERMGSAAPLPSVPPEFYNAEEHSILRGLERMAGR